jgi:DNA-binding NarL/FixJ family response regulator
MDRQESKPPEQGGSGSSDVTRVLIVDDHEVLRDGLRVMLRHRSDLECCGEAVDEGEAMRAVRQLRPDLVVVDIALKSGDGISLIKQIKSFDPAVRIVVYSMYDERLYGERALRAGANAYVNKQDPALTILEAILQVRGGRMAFSDELIGGVLQRAQGGDDLRQSSIEALSDRELEVFRLIGQGASTREIAQKLYLSVNTVNTYRERLKVKLDLENGVELVHRATQWVLEHR